MYKYICINYKTPLINVHAELCFFFKKRKVKKEKFPFFHIRMQ